MCAYALAPLEVVQAEALPLFHHEVRERLNPTALALVLAHAEVLVEGGAVQGGPTRGSFLGTAMLTIDLERLGGRVRPPHDADAARRLAAAIEDDPGARSAIAQHVIDAARARLAAPAHLRVSEPSVRTNGARVLVDLELDAEAR